MGHIQTTFAHGNGPYSRMVELVIAYNDIREKNGYERLSAVFPLVPSYAFSGKEPGSRQVQFMKETAEEAKGKDFLEQHPYELLLDIKQGGLLDRIFYKGSNFLEALLAFRDSCSLNEEEFKSMVEKGRKEVKTLRGETVTIDLRDSEIEFGMNNRLRTNHSNAFYINAGAGYFDEVLLKRFFELSNKKTRDKSEIREKEIIKDVLDNTFPLTYYQKLHFLSDPGVFSYNPERKQKRKTELSSPPQMHIPKLDTTHLEKEGLYVMLTGIEGLAESGIYDIASKMGLQIYSSDDKFNEKHKGIKHPPFKIANPKIIAQVARTGWSSVWSVHMLAEHGLNVGLLFPKHDSKDDPEILMNNLGVKRLGLGVEIDLKNPRKSLEEALELAKGNAEFNRKIKEKYGTLDGIEYIAETIFMYQHGQDISSRLAITPF